MSSADDDELRGLLTRLARSSGAGARRSFPHASLRLGPGFGCSRAIRLSRDAGRWPEELDAPEFRVQDPEPERPIPHLGAPLGTAREAAVLERLALVAAATGVLVFVAFSPARGVLISPDGRLEPRDERAERRLERRRLRAREREQRPARRARAERRRAALAALRGELAPSGAARRAP
ncbi:MAG: hypothetical protein H6831_03845 [Planctomycetes bacterium]|nr:hypothetical protein [Planctomycetota bacterium]